MPSETTPPCGDVPGNSGNGDAAGDRPPPVRSIVVGAAPPTRIDGTHHRRPTTGGGNATTAAVVVDTTLHRAVHKIRLSALARNYSEVESAANRQRCSVIVVVKADGYGHGAIPSAIYLADVLGADAFAVATLEEGIALRKALRETDAGTTGCGESLDRYFNVNQTLNPQGGGGGNYRDYHRQLSGSSRATADIDSVASLATNGALFDLYAVGGVGTKRTNLLRRAAHIRILVLGPPVGFPRCFDDYYHYDIEAMISGPEVATALYEWVSNTDERKRLQVERAANELKKKILLEPPSAPKAAAAAAFKANAREQANGNANETEGADNHSTASSSGRSSTKSSRSGVGQQQLQPQIPSATLTNVTGSDLAKEVREILKNQKLAAETQKQQQQQEHMEQLQLQQQQQQQLQQQQQQQGKANGHGGPAPIGGESASSSSSVDGGNAATTTTTTTSSDDPLARTHARTRRDGVVDPPDGPAGPLEPPERRTQAPRDPSDEGPAGTRGDDDHPRLGAAAGLGRWRGKRPGRDGPDGRPGHRRGSSGMPETLGRAARPGRRRRLGPGQPLRIDGPPGGQPRDRPAARGDGPAPPARPRGDDPVAPAPEVADRGDRRRPGGRRGSALRGHQRGLRRADGRGDPHEGRPLRLQRGAGRGRRHAAGRPQPVGGIHPAREPPGQPAVRDAPPTGNIGPLAVRGPTPELRDAGRGPGSGDGRMPGRLRRPASGGPGAGACFDGPPERNRDDRRRVRGRKGGGRGRRRRPLNRIESNRAELSRRTEGIQCNAKQSAVDAGSTRTRRGKGIARRRSETAGIHTRRFFHPRSNRRVSERVRMLENSLHRETKTISARTNTPYYT
mmetsp:Transcript_19357/g.45012  ORF Transcript_19357/g.45012 Transcript_19357/m.45012 type:complete len:850 (+) Transcript_19357:310-2859(+)